LARPAPFWQKGIRMKKNGNEMKRIAAAVLTAALFLSACGGSSVPGQNSGSKTEQTKEAVVTEQTTQAEEKEETKALEQAGETVSAGEAESAAGEATVTEIPENMKPDPSKKVSSLEVEKMPAKTEYVIGDEFSAEGGLIRILYTDGTEALIAMTDEEVKLSKPTMNTANTKNVAVQYGGKRVVFKVNVAAGLCRVSFSQNYEGAPEATVLEVGKGSKVERPADPVRDGYEFENWYADADFTETFDFEQDITADADIFAHWLKAGSERVQVSFDYDVYGVKKAGYPYPMEKGEAVARPAADPERVGYRFTQWVDAEGNAYDFAKQVTEDTVIKAQWEKTLEGMNEWIFEAEDTDLTGKIGPSFSGSAQEESMIIFNDAIGASGNRLVGYLYANGCSLEFHLASDSDVTDATVAVRIAGEYTTMSYDGNDFQVLVNGMAKPYNKVTIEIAKQDDVAACEDRIVISGVALQKGENLIQLKTNNKNAVAGTTFQANAPMVDCVKVTTSAVVTWDENYGEPATHNYMR